MAIARVQVSTQANAITSTPSASWPAATTAGNLLVAVLGHNGTTATVTGTPAGWVLAATVQSVAGTGSRVSIYRIEGAASRSGAEAFTLSISVRANLVLLEYSGLLASGALDQVATATGTGTAPASGTTATTAAADELAIAAIGGSVGSGTGPSYSAATAGFAIVSQGSAGGGASAAHATAALERIVAATGAYGTAVTSSASLTAASGAVATFKAASGGGGSFSPMSRRTLGPRAGKRGAA